jgi:hypothetical protein
VKAPSCDTSESSIFIVLKKNCAWVGLIGSKLANQNNSPAIFFSLFSLRMAPDATTAAPEGSLLFAQCRPFAILKPKNRKSLVLGSRRSKPAIIP